MTARTRRLLLIAEYSRWAERMDSGRATLEDLAFCANDFRIAILRCEQPKQQAEAA